METGLAVVQNDNILPAMSPQEQVDKASAMAKVLQGVVKQAHLARKFGGEKEHLFFEAWQTIGQFFNCTPQTEWTKAIKDGDRIVGYEARVNVVNSEGRIIASAESMCMRDEPNWKTKPLYALRSMAQTRTAGKALRSVFAWVAVLAGYSGTPAEEMSEEFNHKDEIQNFAPPQKPKITKKELTFIEAATKAKQIVGETFYYRLLGSMGYEHCTELKDEEKDHFLNVLREQTKVMKNGKKESKLPEMLEGM